MTTGQLMLCVECSKPTEQHPLGRPRHYCSARCRVRAHRRGGGGDARKVSAANAGEAPKVSTCDCGHPPDDHDPGGACMHLCDCAWVDVPLFDTPSVTE